MAASKSNTWWSAALRTGLDCTRVLWALVTATGPVRAFSPPRRLVQQTTELSARFLTQARLYSLGSSVAAHSVGTHAPANMPSISGAAAPQGHELPGTPLCSAVPAQPRVPTPHQGRPADLRL